MIGLAILAQVDPAGAHPAEDAGSYRWVNPPTTRTNDNIAPQGRRFTYDAGTLFREFWTPDLQLTLYWPENALGQGEVTFDVSPLDPTDLSPLPSGLSASGNAYRLALLPSGRFARPAIVTLRVPEVSSTVYHSADGSRWRPLRPVDGEPGVVSAEMTLDGYLVAAAQDRHSSSTSTAAKTFAAVGTVAVLLYETRRRRRLRQATAVTSTPSFVDPGAS